MVKPAIRVMSDKKVSLVLIWLLCLPACVRPQIEDVGQVLDHYNRGISWMEQFEPQKAVKEFRKVVQLAPKWVVGRLNLAISLLNTQREEDLVECEKLLLAVQKAEPKNPYAHYTLGMLRVYRTDKQPNAR